jgi:hypothetical protein
MSFLFVKQGCLRPEIRTGVRTNTFHWQVLSRWNNLAGTQERADGMREMTGQQTYKEKEDICKLVEL